MRTLGKVTLLMFLLSAKAYGSAHCFCKLGDPSHPIHDFGTVGEWGTQIGHDSACRDACAMKTDQFMRIAANHAAACTAAHGASVTMFYAVGTKSYQSGGTYNCSQGGGGAAQGSIGFPNASDFVGVMPHVIVNDTDQANLPPGMPFNLPANAPFMTVRFVDKLGGYYHLQRWSVTARLYRDGVLIETLSALSPANGGKDLGVEVTFTQQPRNFARNHTWTITTHYAGPGHGDRSNSFKVSP